MKYLILILALLCTQGSGTLVNAQAPESDSLETLLMQHSESDTIQVNLLNASALKYYLIDDEKSRGYAEEAIALAGRIGYKKGEAEGLSLIGLYYYSKSDTRQALEYTLKSLELANELRLLDVQKNCHKQLSKKYSATGDYSLAYEHHVRFKEQYDSIFNVQEVAKLTNLEYQYKYDREKQALELEQQKRDAIQAEEIKQQQVIRNSFILGFVLMVLLLLVIWHNFLQKRRANRKLAEQKAEIISQNNKIKDSIEAAQRIQKALFPPQKMIDEMLPEYFIFNKPRDIVSGDYYWLAKKEEKTILAVADCTGHGIPGAFMSLLGIAFLNEIVNKSPVQNASDILFQLREHVIRSLHQKGEKYEQRDGMDISICIFNFKSAELQYSGAFSQIYLIRKHELTELKGDKMPVGISVRKDQPFTNKELKLHRDDCIYLCTDGYSDQIGGPRKKTFRSKYFKEFLLHIHDKSMGDQSLLLEKKLDEWRGEMEQIDDILIIGIRV